MRELHLFAGIGGGILAGQLLGHRCVGAVELDDYCCKVLRARQQDGILPSFPIHGDVRTFDARPWRGQVDVVCGGFPCQPWSSAGKRRGVADPRHLWPEMARVVAECRPRFVFAENVSLAAFEQPWRGLRGLGYRVPPALCLGAADVGAPHRRWRWWLLAADADGARLHEQHDLEHVSGSERTTTRTRDDGGAQPLANTNRQGLERRDGGILQERAGQQPAGPGGPSVGDTDDQGELQPQGRIFDQWRRIGDAGWWQTEPDVGRVAHGVPHRVDRLRGLGNAQVPQCAAQAWRILMAEHFSESS